MKPFRDIVIVKQPVAHMWTTVRDRLPELAPLLEDIERITPLEREACAGGWRLVNEWCSRQRVPTLLQSRLGAAAVSWIDRNEWEDGTHLCRWSIEPSLLSEHIRCAGTTRYEPAMGGRGTRVTFAGDFELGAGALAGLAGPLERPLAAFVESIVTILIPKNLRKVMEAAARFAAPV
jgi:hypothetical protein